MKQFLVDEDEYSCVCGETITQLGPVDDVQVENDQTGTVAFLYYKGWIQGWIHFLRYSILTLDETPT